MSVLIKDMGMPTHCIDCPFMVSRDYYDDCILQSAEANENFENWEQMKAGCPLISIPPHGRLIDADELEELFRGVIGNIAKCMEIEPVFEHIVRVSEMVIDMINDTPTIIPAEDKDIKIFEKNEKSM